jgi:formylglycine-generating enzyme required for sulfatase activity
MKVKAWWRVLVCLVWAGLFIGPGQAKAGEEMVQVPAGEFTMGISAEQIKRVVSSLGGQEKYLDPCTPQHKLKTGAFSIDKYEVTNQEYKKFITASKHQPPEDWEGGNYPSGKAKHPVVFVSWSDALAYCKWAGKRLPTEAEWEKAARGTDGRLYPWGNKWDMRKANTAKGRKHDTTPVGNYKKGVSPYGCYDMAGNVWEWTTSYYKPYPNATVENEFFGEERYVVRGGSWDDAPYDALTVARAKFTPQTTFEHLGFRCVR